MKRRFKAAVREGGRIWWALATIAGVGLSGFVARTGSQAEEGHTVLDDSKVVIMTDELQLEYVEAKTRERWLKAKEALVEDWTRRYRGIDASVVGPGAARHGVQFAKLMR